MTLSATEPGRINDVSRRFFDPAAARRHMGDTCDPNYAVRNGAQVRDFLG
jgi:hypothetical protein